jgi:16S rRNA (cytidine1402-2'-O)-methyltransferase
VSANKTSPGCLYLISTPIGNLEDLSPRGLRLLGEVDLIAAEDTRHTRKLLSAFGLKGELLSYREQNRVGAGKRVLAALASGKQVALVCDAGTPGISDPGQDLVAQAVQAGVDVVPVPGPCAAIAALSASGLNTDRFVFLGFLPRKTGPASKLVEGLKSEPGSLVFYESPRRLQKTLSFLHEVLGPRDAVVVRELTKIHETFDPGSLNELAERYTTPPRGEVIVLVAGDSKKTSLLPSQMKALVEALGKPTALSPKQIAKLLAPLSELDRRSIYRLAMESKHVELD